MNSGLNHPIKVLTEGTMKSLFLTLTYLIFISSFVIAGEADVHKVIIERNNDGSFNVHTTVQHDDDGFDHYADRWEILDIDGNVLDTRILAHPHTAEPFTRSIIRAVLPKGIKFIRVRAHDNIHGYGGKVVEVPVPEE